MDQYFLCANTQLEKVKIDVTAQQASIKKKNPLQLSFGCKLHTFTEKGG